MNVSTGFHLRGWRQARGSGLALREAAPLGGCPCLVAQPGENFLTVYSAAANRDGAWWCLYMSAQDQQVPSGLSRLVFANTWELFLKHRKIIARNHTASGKRCFQRTHICWWHLCLHWGSCYFHKAVLQDVGCAWENTNWGSQGLSETTPACHRFLSAIFLILAVFSFLLDSHPSTQASF